MFSNEGHGSAPTGKLFKESTEPTQAGHRLEPHPDVQFYSVLVLRMD